MREFERTFPTLLIQLHQLEFDYDDGNGIDFEPYQEFQSAKDTGDWIKAWTGNHDLTGAEYRIFGQDGSGGYAAFWLVRDGKADPRAAHRLLWIRGRGGRRGARFLRLFVAAGGGHRPVRGGDRA